VYDLVLRNGIIIYIDIIEMQTLRRGPSSRQVK